MEIIDIADGMRAEFLARTLISQLQTSSCWVCLDLLAIDMGFPRTKLEY
jgi:hypothetical protein